MLNHQLFQTDPEANKRKLKKNRNKILHNIIIIYTFILYFIVAKQFTTRVAVNVIPFTNKMTQSNKNHHVKETKTELPFRVAQWFYKHGLFLSSYPTCASSLAIFMVLFAW